MYSQDGGLERIEASAGASYVASIVNFVEPNRVIPYMLYHNNVGILKQRNSYCVT